MPTLLLLLLQMQREQRVVAVRLQGMVLGEHRMLQG